MIELLDNAHGTHMEHPDGTQLLIIQKERTIGAAASLSSATPARVGRGPGSIVSGVSLYSRTYTCGWTSTHVNLLVTPVRGSSAQKTQNCTMQTCLRFKSCADAVMRGDQIHAPDQIKYSCSRSGGHFQYVFTVYSVLRWPHT